MTDEFGIGPDIVWSACGEEDLLNIKTQVGILPLDAQTYAVMTVSTFPPLWGDMAANSSQVDSTDLKYTQYFHIQWRQCKK